MTTGRCTRAVKESGITPAARTVVPKQTPAPRGPAADVLSVQRTAGNQAAIAGLRGGGRPLDPGTRGFMESRLGRDFSGVRVHSNAQAGERADALGARAFTVGHDVVLGPGRYAPETGEGRRLLAHELTHVAQQTAATGPRSAPSAAESEAVRAGVRVAGGGIAAVQGSVPIGVQRDELSEEEKRHRKPCPTCHDRNPDTTSRKPPAFDWKSFDPSWLKTGPSPVQEPPGDPLAHRPSATKNPVDWRWEQPASVKPVCHGDCHGDTQRSALTKPKPSITVADMEAIARHKETPIRTPFEERVRGKNADLTSYRPIYHPETDEIIGYSYVTGGRTLIVDIEQTFVWSEEIPITSDLLSPVDLIPFGVIGSLGAKAATISGRLLAKGAAKFIAKEAIQVGGEDVAKVGGEAILKAGADAATKKAAGGATEALGELSLKTGAGEAGRVTSGVVGTQVAIVKQAATNAYASAFVFYVKHAHQINFIGTYTVGTILSVEGDIPGLLRSMADHPDQAAFMLLEVYLFHEEARMADGSVGRISYRGQILPPEGGGPPGQTRIRIVSPPVIEEETTGGSFPPPRNVSSGRKIAGPSAQLKPGDREVSYLEDRKRGVPPSTEPVSATVPAAQTVENVESVPVAVAAGDGLTHDSRPTGVPGGERAGDGKVVPFGPPRTRGAVPTTAATKPPAKSTSPSQLKPPGPKDTDFSDVGNDPAVQTQPPGTVKAPKRRNTYPPFESTEDPATGKDLRANAAEQVNDLSTQLNLKLPANRMINLPDDRVLDAPNVGRIRNSAGEAQSSSTSEGYLRNESRFWTKFKELFPTDFALIGPGRTVTPALAQKYGWPSSYVGDKLVHHHVKNSQFVVALPESVHRSQSGDIHMTPKVEGTP